MTNALLVDMWVRAEAVRDSADASQADYNAAVSFLHALRQRSYPVPTIIVDDHEVRLLFANGVNYYIYKSSMVASDWYSVYAKKTPFEKDCMMARNALGWYESRLESGHLPEAGGRIN